MDDRVYSASQWRFACPHCGHPDFSLAGDSARCVACGVNFVRHASVWDLLPPERTSHYAEFLRNYTTIRIAEGRGSDRPEFYRRLPDCPPAHALARQWRIRRRSYAALMALVRSELEPASKLIDLGAGVGWLSNRLAQMGYAPCAVDLSSDESDGLRAARHFDGRWPRIIAEFDCLPIVDGEADAAIFNGSLHYSTDYVKTLLEAKRVVRRGGLLIVLDTPVYRNPESGRRMLQEQYDEFEQRYGLRSDSLPALGFLTWDLLEQLGQRTGLRWQHRLPWYGWRWAVRPLFARLRGRREPARFALIWARR